MTDSSCSFLPIADEVIPPLFSPSFTTGDRLSFKRSSHCSPNAQALLRSEETLLIFPDPVQKSLQVYTLPGSPNRGACSLLPQASPVLSSSTVASPRHTPHATRHLAVCRPPLVSDCELRGSFNQQHLPDRAQDIFGAHWNSDFKK